MLADLPFLEEVSYVFVAGVWEVELLVVRARAGYIVLAKMIAQFFINSSLSLVLLFRRRLKSVADVLKGIRSKGFTQSRWDALLRYWGAVCRHGPFGLISSLHPWDNWVPPDLHGFYKWVFDSLEVLNGFLRQVVVSRRDDGIRKWTRWLREDMSSRPYVFGFGLTLFLLLLSQLSRILRLSLLRSWLNLILLMLSFGRPGCLFFCRSGWSSCCHSWSVPGFCRSSFASGAFLGSSSDYGSGESCDHQFLAPLLNFFGYPDGAATELFNGTLKLRYSSTPFSKKFPSWPVSNLSDHSPVVGSGPGPNVHFPDHDPVFERPAKRFRITSKSSTLRREPFWGDGLPTPKRWKRLVPQGTGFMRIEDGLPPFLFPRTGVG